MAKKNVEEVLQQVGVPSTTKKLTLSSPVQASARKKSITDDAQDLMVAVAQLESITGIDRATLGREIIFAGLNVLAHKMDLYLVPEGVEYRLVNEAEAEELGLFLQQPMLLGADG